MSLLRFIAPLSLSFLTFACDDAPVQVHRVPKSAAAPAEDVIAQRLLGAIVPDGDHTWFFKLMGPQADVTAVAPAFSEFVHSVKIDGAAARPVTFTLPAGWTDEPGSGMRYATVKIGGALEASIIRLDGPAGGVLANVNRWRDQLGLAPFSEQDLKTECVEADLNGHPAVLVDFAGSAKAGAPPMMGLPRAESTNSSGSDTATTRAPPPAPAPTPPTATAPAALPLRNEGAEAGTLTYSHPPEWKEKVATGVRVAAFTVGDAELTVIPFSGDVGGELANVNRWRDQVGLGPLDPSQVDTERTTVAVDGTEAHIYFMSGPATADGGARAMLGAIVPRPGFLWFFKLLGPAETVNQERANFDAFLRSVKFASGAGDDDGR